MIEVLPAPGLPLITILLILCMYKKIKPVTLNKSNWLNEF
jgi:hypothetical protein